MQRFIVPVDGSSASWVGVEVAAALARRLDALVHVVEIVFSPDDIASAEKRVDERLEDIDPDVECVREVRLSSNTVAATIEQMVEAHSGSTVVMASHGRGRSAALVGSVAEDLLQRLFGPVLLVGPHAEPSDFTGPIIVSVDGSHHSESVLPLAASWAIELGVHPWITHVMEPDTASMRGHDVTDSVYPARLAHHLSTLSGHRVEFEELHDRHPAEAVPAFATRLKASMIVAASHGHSGLSRLTMGSITAGFVKHATCPVLVVRPPHVAESASTTATAGRHV